MPTMDFGGNVVVAQSFSTSPTPGGTQTALTGITSSAQTLTGAKTFASTPVLGAGTTVDLDSATATLVSNAATLTKYAGVITTEALTTAAGASQAFVLTLTGVAAGDLAFVQGAGGTNTRRSFRYDAVTTTNTITVTVYNNEPTNAINGTLIFNIWVLKA